jgi:FkbM family methyltransferase
MRVKEILRTSTVARLFREQLNKLRMSADSPFKSITKNLTLMKLTHVLDVGANIGQFGIDIRRHGFDGQIISFEPTSDAYETLSKTIKRHQPWKAIQIGLGSSESQQTINISGNAGLSSSLLQIGPIHLINFPESATVATQKVLISTVDKQLDFLGIDPKTVMLKLDVQGYESEVLKGASRYLSEIPLCYLEVSMIGLYEGEITFLPILNILSESGHEVIDVFRGLRTKNGQLLQLDILTKLTKS